jgi:hypothetical protein
MILERAALMERPHGRRLEPADGGMDYTVGVRVDARFTNAVFAVEKHVGKLGKPQVQPPGRDDVLHTDVMRVCCVPSPSIYSFSAVTDRPGATDREQRSPFAPLGSFSHTG